ncbi:MAG TPA: MBOAT family O-acyltransferase [Pseudobdellovibrionaceae bacterium]|nr:MBOAT family O-acyltransferase [Pseudobdellovibrionaceae bacterium]
MADQTWISGQFTWAFLAIGFVALILSVAFQRAALRVWTWAWVSIGVALLSFGVGAIGLLGVALANFALIVFFQHKSKTYQKVGLLLSAGSCALPILFMRTEHWPQWWPVAWAFFGLQQWGAVVEILRQSNSNESKERGLTRSDFRNWLCYSLFFPSLWSGPVLRWSLFVKELESPSRFSFDRGINASLLFLQGLLIKLSLAVPLWILIGAIYESLRSGIAPSWTLWLGLGWLVRYALWAEIASHTDAARASAHLLGVNLPINFDRPFAATTLADFWRRWHMSLSQWLQDFVFYPLWFGRWRRWGNWGLAAALLGTFALFGLWHGWGWVFVAFGIWKGLGVLLDLFAHRSMAKGFNAMGASGAVKRIRLLADRFLALVSLSLFVAAPSFLIGAWMLSPESAQTNPWMQIEFVATQISRAWTETSWDWGSVTASAPWVDLSKEFGRGGIERLAAWMMAVEVFQRFREPSRSGTGFESWSRSQKLMYFALIILGILFMSYSPTSTRSIYGE